MKLKFARSSGTTNQPWKNVHNKGAHLRLSNQAGLDTVKLLREHGFQPQLVTWENFTTGTFDELEAFQGEHHQALTHIFFEKPGHCVMVCLRTGWCYPATIQGAAVMPTIKPMSREQYIALS